MKLTGLLQIVLFLIPLVHSHEIHGAEASVQVKLQTCNGLESHLDPGFNVRAFHYPSASSSEYNQAGWFYTGYAANNAVTSNGSYSGSINYNFGNEYSVDQTTTSAFNMIFDYTNTILEFTGYFHAENTGIYTFNLGYVPRSAALFLGSESLLQCCSNVYFETANDAEESPYLLAAVNENLPSVAAIQLLYLDEGYYPLRYVTNNFNSSSNHAQLSVLTPGDDVYGAYKDIGSYLYKYSPSIGSCVEPSTFSASTAYSLSTTDVQSVDMYCSSLASNHSVCLAYSPLPKYCSTTSYSGSSTITSNYTLSTGSVGDYTQIVSEAIVSVPYITRTVTASWTGYSTSLVGPVITSTVVNSNKTLSYWELTVCTPAASSSLVDFASYDSSQGLAMVAKHHSHIPASKLAKAIKSVVVTITDVSVSTTAVNYETIGCKVCREVAEAGPFLVTTYATTTTNLIASSTIICNWSNFSVIKDSFLSLPVSSEPFSNTQVVTTYSPSVEVTSSSPQVSLYLSSSFSVEAVSSTKIVADSSKPEYISESKDESLNAYSSVLLSDSTSEVQSNFEATSVTTTKLDHSTSTFFSLNDHSGNSSSSSDTPAKNAESASTVEDGANTLHVTGGYFALFSSIIYFLT